VDKKQARQEIRRRLEKLGPETIQDRSRRICSLVSELGEFRSADPIMLYMATADEVQTAPLAEAAFAAGKTVLVPKVDWSAREMHAIEIRHWQDGIVTGRYGLSEPEFGQPEAVEEIAFVVVPAMAFDARGRRLGRGGGFYDRFLSQRGLNALACGVAMDEQILPDLPAEPHDVPVDMVVTESRILRFNKAQADEPGQGVQSR
jgi:5-formyltetrahydrofolate cyclo-ligase